MSHYQNKPDYLKPIYDVLKENGGIRLNQHYHYGRNAQMYMYKMNK
jgi:hypothetical protein